MIGRVRSHEARSETRRHLRRMETRREDPHRKDPKHSITGAQIRAARGFLRWSASRLATVSQLSILTVRRAEGGDGVPPINPNSIDALQSVLEANGIVFLDENSDGPGVRLRRVGK
jgi:DNA-binding transcriptional regulator YiaG